jgi:hypothetical protein
MHLTCCLASNGIGTERARDPRIPQHSGRVTMSSVSHACAQVRCMAAQGTGAHVRLEQRPHLSGTRHIFHSAIRHQRQLQLMDTHVVRAAGFNVDIDIPEVPRHPRVYPSRGVCSPHVALMYPSCLRHRTRSDLSRKSRPIKPHFQSQLRFHQQGYTIERSPSPAVLSF